MGDFVESAAGQVFRVVFFAAATDNAGKSVDGGVVVLARVPSPYHTVGDGEVTLHRQSVMSALSQFSVNRGERTAIALDPDELAREGIVRTAVAPTITSLVNSLNLGRFLCDAVPTKIVADVPQLSPEDCVAVTSVTGGGQAGVSGGGGVTRLIRQCTYVVLGLIL
jgi:hypothetical protein